MNFWRRPMNTSSRSKSALAVTMTALLLIGSVGARAATIKIATIAPDGFAWMIELRDAGKQIEAATQSRVKFKFYPGGVMGDDFAVLRKMRVGQLQGAMVTTAVFNKIFTDVQLYNLPMQFQGLDEVDYVRKRLDPILMAGLEENGFVTLGIVEVGMAYAMSKQRASSVAGVGQLKVWTPQGDLAMTRAIQAFDILPIPLTIADVLAGLQTGLIDTVATPPVATIALQWHTRLDYILDLPLLYIYGLMVIDKKPFSRLTAADQATVREIMSAAIARADARSRNDHAAAWQVLQDQGLELVKPSPQEIADWQRHADLASQQWVEDGIVSQDLYQTLNAHLAEFRSGLAH